MVFKNGVKNIQATAYNGTRTVLKTVYHMFEHPVSKQAMCFMICVFRLQIQ